MASGWAGLDSSRPAVMGIVNVTPDSFSDGGRHFDPACAVAAGEAMAAAGAEILDIGGESTRPGAAPVPPEEEQRRILPVIFALARRGICLSVDTRNAATMAAALDAGAAIVNDVSALAYDPAALPLVAARGAPVVLMHMRGTPATMMGLASYIDVVTEVRDELALRVRLCLDAGVKPEAIMLDPGIGFAKTRTQNAALLRGLPVLAALGYPLLVGLSRKSLIGSLAAAGAEAPEPAARLAGSLAGALFALSRGAAILRVHDVAETVQALRVWCALAGEGTAGSAFRPSAPSPSGPAASS